MDARTVYRTNALFFAALAIGISACSPDAEGPPEGMTARDRLEAAVANWNSTSAFHFVLQLDGRWIQLDPGGMMTFNQVAGDVVAPDRMQAETTIRTPVGNTQMAYIAIGDSQWITNPLTRRWEPAPPEAGGSVSGLFDPQTGIGTRLIEMENLQETGEEVVDGTRVVRLTGTLPGSVLEGFAPDLATVPAINVDLLVGAEDHRIRQIVVREPAAGDAAAATWNFQFSRFDEPISIQPPA